MPTLYLEWGEDFVLTPKGSLQMATGWDEVRQRIERFLLTNALAAAGDGSIIPPDYLFDTNYGLGAGRRVDENITPDTIGSIQQKVYQAVMSDPDVDDSFPPSIALYRQTDHTLLLVIGVKTKSGFPGRVAISFR
jgi:hypothetical protein